MIPAPRTMRHSWAILVALVVVGLVAIKCGPLIDILAHHKTADGMVIGVRCAHFGEVRFAFDAEGPNGLTPMTQIGPYPGEGEDAYRNRHVTVHYSASNPDHAILQDPHEKLLEALIGVALTALIAPVLILIRYRRLIMHWLRSRQR